LWLGGELARRGLAPAPSQANVLWMTAPGGDAAALAQRIAHGGVTVATGAVLGEPAHLRVTVRDRPASGRFLRALDAALG
ncbi:MAG: hypothetical protein H0T43_07800, partial [Solirubrobacterales bacterium]|nr:hypothetical protein [Solirubrobacterales bacterium]